MNEEVPDAVRRVQVADAPGYDDFKGEEIMCVPSADGRLVSIVGDPITKEIFVIDAQHVEYLD